MLSIFSQYSWQTECGKIRVLFRTKSRSSFVPLCLHFYLFFYFFLSSFWVHPSKSHCYIHSKKSKNSQAFILGATIKMERCNPKDFIMHPTHPSKARLGGVHFIFRHIQICTRLLQGELFKVPVHIRSNGSHFLTARVLVY